MTDRRLEPILAAHRAGRFGEAEAGYRRCMQEGFDVALPFSALLLQQSRYAEAIEVLEPLHAARPQNANVAVNLSIALRKSGRGEEALQIARRASALVPGHPGACNARGLAALELGDAQEALQAFEEGLRAAPAHTALELHRAKALRKLGRLREALATLERVAAVAPGLLELWRDLGAVQAALGLREPALASAARALALAPGDADVALAYAVALLRAGRTAEAVQRMEKLEEHAPTWLWLGQARLRQGDIAAARAAFARAAESEPDNPSVKHFMAALSGTLPDHVEVDYIRGLFDDFADRFEFTLVERLAYATPQSLARFIDANGAVRRGDVLDLGCGTGLMGVELAAAGRCIDGIDLSERMLAHAREKGVYRELHAAELLDFLRNSPAHWDLIVAADVFVYIADLQPIFAAVFERLTSDGCFAFSIECSDTGDTQLPARTGRYRHAPERVAEALLAAGFVGIHREEAVLRIESGAPVAGELVLARRA